MGWVYGMCNSRLPLEHPRLARLWCLSTGGTVWVSVSRTVKLVDIGFILACSASSSLSVLCVLVM
jgi:hypothetical protein